MFTKISVGILRYPSQIPVPLEHIKNETRLRIPVTSEHSQIKADLLLTSPGHVRLTQ